MRPRTRISHGFRVLCPWVLVAATCACAPAAVRLPSSMGSFHGADRTPLLQSRRACRFVANMSARVLVSGVVDGRQVRRDLSIGTNSGVLARLDSAGDPVRPPFVLWATDARSRLYFPQTNQLIENQAAEPLIERVLGIPIGLADLYLLTLGCPEDDWADVWAPRDNWLRLFDDLNQIYLHRASARHPWSLVAVDHRVVKSPFGWRARFLEQRADNMPVRLRITSLEWNGVEATRFDLRLVFRDIQVNPPQPFEDYGNAVALTATHTAIASVEHQWPLIASALPRRQSDAP